MTLTRESQRSIKSAAARRLHLVVAELKKLVDDLEERLEEITEDGT